MRGAASSSSAASASTVPVLRLAGFFSYFDTQRILVIGLTEHEYLRSFSSEERKEKIKKLFDCGEIPCVIFSRDLPVLPEFMEFARATATPIFPLKPPHDDGHGRPRRLSFAACSRPRPPFTAFLMDVFGVGILITGSSGVGKSETSMELIKRGHRLVADDSVLIKRVSSGLVGTAPERIRYFMELRGIGIINVKNMYGSGSILDEKQVEVIMELEHWQRDKQYDRIGGEKLTEEILGVKVPKLVVPVSPGRNLSILIEVAARNQAPQKHGLRRGAGTHPTHHRQMKQELLAPRGDIAAQRLPWRRAQTPSIWDFPHFPRARVREILRCPNFPETVRLAHLLGAKVYVCLNTLVKDGETDAFFESALASWNLGADALLIQDIFLGKELKRRYPSMMLHLSTQAGCCNVYGAELAKRVRLFARCARAGDAARRHCRPSPQSSRRRRSCRGRFAPVFRGSAIFPPSRATTAATAADANSPAANCIPSTARASKSAPMRSLCPISASASASENCSERASPL